MPAVTEDSPVARRKAHTRQALGKIVQTADLDGGSIIETRLVGRVCRSEAQTPRGAGDGVCDRTEMRAEGMP